MHAKSLRFHGSARDKICAGLNTLANAVKVTLGPKGRTVILEHGYGAPTVINSGVVVAREIELEDHFENVGAHLAREVAAKTSETAGDGTTTATVLAQAIVNDGLRYVTAGLDPMDVKRGIEAAVTAVVAEVKRNSKPCATNQEIAQVGTISANGDADIGAMIAEAMAKVGENGVIKSEEGRGRTNELEIVEGMQFDRGYLSPYFVTDTEKRRIVLEDASVLLYDDTISGIAPLLPILEEVAREGRPLLVVAEDVAGEALATLVLNTLRGVIRTCAVKAPGFGDNRKLLLQDMAILTGGALVSADMGMTLETVKLAQLGRVRRIEIDKDSTTLIGSAGTAEAIRTRLGQLRAEREKATTDYDRGQFDDRIARLSGGVALIKVGASTETEMREKRSRVEDALHATRAAMAEGIGPGGGVALLRARHVLDAMKGRNLAQDAGIRIVARALEEPLRQIVANAGQDPAVVLERVLAGSGNEGYDAATNQYGDVVAMGIIDPTKVTRLALENAASIASLILTTDCVIADTAEASAETEEPELA